MINGLILTAIGGFAISLAIYAIYELKVEGKKWLKKIKNIELNDSTMIKIETKETQLIEYIYNEPFGYFDITKKEGSSTYRIHCHYNENAFSYLTYDYDIEKDETSNVKEDFRRLSWILGDKMSLPKSELEKSIAKIKDVLNEKVKEIHKRSIRGEEESIKEKSIVQMIQDGQYRRIDSSLGIEFHFSNDKSYRWKKSDKTETFEYLTRTGYIIYTITRDIQNKKTYEFHIEKHYLKDIEDEVAFAHEQEDIWKEMKNEVKRQKEKEEKLLKAWKHKAETTETKSEGLSSIWCDFEKEITSKIKRISENKEMISTEEEWYLEKTLPKIMKDTKALIRKRIFKGSEIGEIQENIEKILNRIENKIVNEEEKQKRKIVVLSSVDM